MRGQGHQFTEARSGLNACNARRLANLLEIEVIDIKSMVGLTFASVERRGDDELIFASDDGRIFRFYHSQDCCENVYIESIVGDLSDLVGSPLLNAEEVTFDNVNPGGITVPEYQDSFTWTFYKFATIKGYVDVRWYGESNGYYSESVCLEAIPA